MKKIYSLVAMVMVALAVNAQTVVIDARINEADNIWTSATSNWDWDQGPNAPANVYEQGETLTINFEHLVDDAYTAFGGDSMTVMFGWFTMGGLTGDDWTFLEPATYNVVLPTIYAADWNGADAYDYDFTIPASTPTTAANKTAVVGGSSTPDADFYMMQIKGWKDGAAYGPANININIAVKLPTSDDDVVAADVVLAPNPAVKGDVVSVDGAVEVYNIAGALVLTAVDAINTSDLDAGVYFVKAEAGTAKLVVE